MLPIVLCVREGARDCARDSAAIRRARHPEVFGNRCIQCLESIMTQLLSGHPIVQAGSANPCRTVLGAPVRSPGC